MFILEQSGLFAEAVQRALELTTGIRVSGAVRWSEGALAILRSTPFDVLLFDTGGVDALWICQVLRLREALGRIRMVVLGGRISDEDLLHGIEAGASGFVPGEASLAELLATLAAVHQGKIRCPPRVAARIAARIRELSAALGRGSGPGEPSLTQREREILGLVAAGLSNKEIARLLGVRVSTAKSHLRSLFAKLGVTTRHEAAMTARRRGMLGKEA